jgi:hypothetical protein
VKFKCGLGEEPYSSEQTIPMVADLRALHEQTHRSPLDLVIGDSGTWCMHIRVEDSVLVPDADPPVTRRAGASSRVASDTAAASAGAKAALAAVHEKSQQPGDKQFLGVHGACTAIELPGSLSSACVHESSERGGDIAVEFS